MKIYTKSGDQGTTSLVSGRRVDKDEILLEAYGTVDELNSFIGLLIAEDMSSILNLQFNTIQNKLFNIGSILAKDGLDLEDYPTIADQDVLQLEQWIDEHNENLSPLTNFILPSGSKAIALAHVCRTICRRAERRTIAIDSPVDSVEVIIQYLNRLSDYFFICARHIARIQKVEEVNWNKNLND